MLLDEALQRRAEGDRQRPPVAVDRPQSAVGKTVAPRIDREPEPLHASIAPPPPGHFLLAEHETDCARFLAETKKRARCRAETALQRRSSAWLEAPEHY